MDKLVPQSAPGSGVERVLRPHIREIAPGVAVKRFLPAIEQRTVGPFVFLDQMGPVIFPKGSAADVRPHPHIGLATVTYLFEGEIVHRDSLGSVQSITPGAVNWMTAGRGIAHSERTPPHLRDAPTKLFGLQFWVGLPTAHEETAPAFAHHPRESLPTIAMAAGGQARLIVGALFGERSPVATTSETLLADLDIPATRVTIPASHRQRAILVLSGPIHFGETPIDTGSLVVLEEGAAVKLSTTDDARCVLFGGDPLDGPRHLWWNFAHSSKERIEQAKADWKYGRFGSIPGETEFIPLPE